ncbi:MAG: flagellar biosynthesis protein [Gemmobacter sp.]
MTQRLKFEVFETEEGSGRPMVVLDGEELEDTRLAAFEQGYRAGWDDAAAAQADAATQTQDTLAQCLGTLAADRTAMLSHVLAVLRPLIEDMTACILPTVARAALPHQIADALLPFAEIVGDTPVDLRINPAAAAEAEAILIARGPDLPVRIVEDPALGQGQATIRLGTSETRIDLDGAVSRIARLTDEFFAQLAKERPDG